MTVITATSIRITTIIIVGPMHLIRLSRSNHLHHGLFAMRQRMTQWAMVIQIKLWNFSVHRSAAVAGLHLASGCSQDHLAILSNDH